MCCARSCSGAVKPERGGGASTANTTSRFSPRLRTECTTPEGAKAPPPAETNWVIVAHLDLGVAFEYDVKLVLAGVGMRRVFLSGLETIEAGEQVSPRAMLSSPFFGKRIRRARPGALRSLSWL